MSDYVVDTLTVETTLNAPTSATTTSEISAAVSAHSSLTNNPHATTKSQVGLANVDNTSDANKPVSTATQTALNLKYDSSNPSGFQTAAQVSASISAVVAAAPAALDTLNELAAALGNDANFAGTVTSNLALKAPIASPTFTGTVSGITKAMVGLGNCDNTSDLAKPISTATQTALDGKANLAGGNTFTGAQNMGGTFTNIVPAPLNMVNSAPAALRTQLNLVNAGGGSGAGSSIDFHTYDVLGGENPGARIGAIDNNYSADLTFSTKVPGGPTNAINERMRVTNSGQVAVGTVSPNASAKVQIDSTTQGFLPPRMTSTQRNSIAAVAGLVVYDTTVDNLYKFNGTQWIAWTVFGNNYEFFTDTAASTTTSGAQPLTAGASSFTTASVPAGTYRIGMQYHWTNSSVTADSRFALFVDGVQVGNQHNEECQDNTSNKNDQIIGNVTLAAGTHTIELRFGSEALITTTVNRVDCEFWRVS